MDKNVTRTDDSSLILPRRATQVSAEQAVICQKDVDETVLVGAPAASRLGKTLALSIEKARGVGATPITDVVSEAVRPIVALLASGMMAAHARGRLRVIQEAATKGTIALARGAYDDALKALRKQLALKTTDLAAIKGKYGWSAAKVHKDIVSQIDRGYKRSIKRAVEAGRSPEEAAAEFVDDYIRNGYASAEPHVLETQFRTNMQMAYSAGKWNASQDPALGVWGFEYVTMRDNLVRPAHRDLDGTVLPKGHSLWATIAVPNGWNCRCMMVELFKEFPIVMPVRVDVDPGFAFNPGVVYQDQIRPRPLSRIEKAGKGLPRSRHKAAASPKVFRRGKTYGGVRFKKKA